MNVDLQKLAKSQVKLTISLTEEEMKAYEQKALTELQNHVKVAGFRPGHIPVEILKEQVGEQGLKAQVLDSALSESYEKALRENEVHAVAYPEIKILSYDPLKYEATVAVKPEVKWKKEVNKITVKRQKPEVKTEDVETVLANFLKQTKSWKDVERETKKDDRVEIDFDGFDEAGVPLDGTSSKNHPLVLGSNSMIPGFEDELIGLKKDEEKEFWITFPKDYHSESFKNKKVRFKIKVSRIEEGSERTADDDWAKEVSGDPEKNLEGLKKDVHTELLKQKDLQEDSRLEEAFLKEIMAHVDIEVPEALVEREIEIMIERMEEDLKKKGTTFAAYEAEQKEKGKDVREELKKPAQEQVLMRLGIEKLFELENPVPTEQDVQEEIDRVLGRYPEHFKAMVLERYKQGTEGYEHMKSGARFRKLLRAHTEE